MSISYPLSLPSAFAAARVSFRATSQVGMTRSPFTGAQQTYEWSNQILAADIQCPPMQRAAAEEVVAFLLSLRGMAGSFLLGPLVGTAIRGAGGGTPAVNGGSQTGNSLVTDGWSAGVTGILEPGDWFELTSGGVRRLYKNLTRASSDGSGNATLDIFPRLRTAPNDNALLDLSAPLGQFMLAGNSTEWTIEEAQFYGVSFTAVEDLRDI
jgi:hypothetical protein